MSEHRATIAWSRTTDGFQVETYDRAHEWIFPGGLSVPASAAPDYHGDPKLLNPEDALVAALSSCHMLTFLWVCARRGAVVDSYEDDAVGVLEKGADGLMAITRVTLRPRVTFADPNAVSEDQLASFHEKAHRGCFIANSVKTEVTVEPR